MTHRFTIEEIAQALQGTQLSTRQNPITLEDVNRATLVVQILLDFFEGAAIFGHAVDQHTFQVLWLN